jgi:transposase
MRLNQRARLTRKNGLFAGSEGGGRTNNVDPLDWLSQTLTRIAKGWPVSQLEALMPWNFKHDAIG